MKEKYIMFNFKFNLKKENRFLVEFPFEFNISSWLVDKVDLPHKSEGIWNDISIYFIDPIEINTTKILYDLLQKNVSNFRIKISDLNGKSDPFNFWEINVDTIRSVNFGQVNYESDQIRKIVLKLKVIDCKLVLLKDNVL